MEVIKSLVKALILADGRRDKRTRADVVGREIPIHGSTEIVFYDVLCFFLHDVDGIKRYQFLLGLISEGKTSEYNFMNPVIAVY